MTAGQGAKGAFQRASCGRLGRMVGQPEDIGTAIRLTVVNWRNIPITLKIPCLTVLRSKLEATPTRAGLIGGVTKLAVGVFANA